MDAADPIRFEAVIVPHRSLTQGGLRRLVWALCGLGMLTGLRFWALGAWPILMFMGVEMALAVWLLHLNMRAARASEMLLLSERCVRVIRTDPKGLRTERTFSAAWLNVVIEEQAGTVPRLLLAAHNVREEIGGCLGETAKRDLAAALGGALHRLRHPSFDNPQLAEDACGG